MTIRAAASFCILLLSSAFASGQSVSLIAPRTVAPVSVLAIHDARHADLILLSSGHDAGLRQGMVLRVTRDRQTVADLVIVDLRLQAATALILDLANAQSLQPGDLAKVRTF